MQIQSLKLVYFSPTGTTRSIVQGIARGMNHGNANLVDITPSDARKQRLQASENELLLVAVPVYAGRVPALLREWLNTIEASDTPAVCVVVYGNREYDDALLELKNIMTERGCMPIACAAYIGEHSFSSSETPIAVARPDTSDLNHAEWFGRKIIEKITSIASVDQVSDIEVPGNIPYRKSAPLLSVDFIDVNDACTQCGACEDACPVRAIELENGILVDKEKCILCCACIKSCPESARTMKSGAVKDIAMHLSQTCKVRKEPEFFLASGPGTRGSPREH